MYPDWGNGGSQCNREKCTYYITMLFFSGSVYGSPPLCLDSSSALPYMLIKIQILHE